MTLGDHFPKEERLAAARRNLAPGVVIKLFVKMDDGQHHWKRFVVVHVDANTVACVINTKPSPLLTNRPALARCQKEMVRAAHPFMDHDSWVDCSKARTYTTSEVLEALADDPACVLGRISLDMRQAIVGAMRVSPVIRAVDCAVYVASLEAATLQP